MPNNCILLIDTFNTMDGLDNAIIVAKELEKKNKRLLGVRIDSGDLAYLSKKARTKLDKNGLEYVKIVASNDLDEFLIKSLKNQKSKISVWGIGTKLVTAYDNPSLGAVYKLTALKNSEGNWDKKIKLSEQKIKINNPGINQILRFKKKELFGGDMIYDSIAETVGNKMIDPNDSTRYKKFNKKYSHEKLLIKIFEKGKLIYNCPP